MIKKFDNAADRDAEMNKYLKPNGLAIPSVSEVCRYESGKGASKVYILQVVMKTTQEQSDAEWVKNALKSPKAKF